MGVRRNHVEFSPSLSRFGSPPNNPFIQHSTHPPAFTQRTNKKREPLARFPLCVISLLNQTFHSPRYSRVSHFGSPPLTKVCAAGFHLMLAPYQ
jgi:hypothetical protein